jgi:hypothetical protein
MPKGKGTYGSKVGRPPKKSAKTMNKSEKRLGILILSNYKNKKS